MTSITAQQTKLDLELVPKENRLDIGKCNGRIPHGLKPKEETFQVVLDALALTLCYSAFLITADVPEVYMHQFWNCIYKHDDFYRFKIDKKRFKLTLEVFKDIFQICPRVPSRDFDALPSEEDTISFLRDLGEGNDSEMTEAQQGNENLETTQEQVVEDAHVIISTVPKKTEVPVISSFHSSDLASKFLNFSDILQTDAEIVSLLDVHVHHEVPRTQAPTLLTIPVSVIPESSSVFINIPQSSYTFTPTPIQATPTPPSIIETINPLSNLPDF
ncbi:hypothetical protein Tco_0520236 [Tanacetum coccineum]